MYRLTLVLSALALSATAVSASTISVSTFSIGQYNTLHAGLGGNLVEEDFETFNESNVGGLNPLNPFRTNVGDFVTLGGTGSGGTVRNADNTFTGLGGANPNDGSQLAIRDGNVFGRVSTTALLTGDSTKDKFLDSNDTYGISWDVDAGGASFTQILLTLTDAADSGATVTITADGGGFAQFQSAPIAGQPRSNQKIVLIDFGGAVSGATVEFANTNGVGGALKTNDGLALDDIAISTVPGSITPVPLPPSALLLGAGVLGLMGLRRRRRAVA